VEITVHDGVIAIELGAEAHGRDGDVTLIAFERSAVSVISRGENSGRTLNEHNIVRAMRPLGQYGGTGQTYHVDLSSLPKDATDVAVIVQALGQRAVLGAAQLPVR
jgi:hypothetical protein